MLYLIGKTFNFRHLLQQREYVLTKENNRLGWAKGGPRVVFSLDLDALNLPRIKIKLNLPKIW